MAERLAATSVVDREDIDADLFFAKAGDWGGSKSVITVILLPCRDVALSIGRALVASESDEAPLIGVRDGSTATGVAKESCLGGVLGHGGLCNLLGSLSFLLPQDSGDNDPLRDDKRGGVFTVPIAGSVASS